MSREVANLTERKNPHTPVYGVKYKAAIFFEQSMGSKNGNFTKDYLIFHQILWLPELFFKQLKYDFLAGNNYPDSPHLQGV